MPCNQPTPRVQVRDGKVANITAKKAGEMLKEGWVLLDVRPQEEIAKVRPGSTRHGWEDVLMVQCSSGWVGDRLWGGDGFGIRVAASEGRVAFHALCKAQWLLLRRRCSGSGVAVVCTSHRHTLLLRLPVVGRPQAAAAAAADLAQAKVVGAVEVPLFVLDDDMSPAGLLKQVRHVLRVLNCRCLCGITT